MTFYDDPNRECVGLAPIWGGAGTDNVPNATGATAGTPGTWTPAGSDPPADAAQASQWGVVASPATAWTTTQYVQGSTAGAPGEMTWTGSAWVGGRAPLAAAEGAEESKREGKAKA
jgi:hypothetical protein